MRETSIQIKVEDTKHEKILSDFVILRAKLIKLFIQLKLVKGSVGAQKLKNACVHRQRVTYFRKATSPEINLTERGDAELLAEILSNPARWEHVSCVCGQGNMSVDPPPSTVNLLQSKRVVSHLHFTCESVLKRI